VVVGVGQVEAAVKDAVEGAWGMRVFRWGDLDPQQRAHYAVGQHAAKLTAGASVG